MAFRNDSAPAVDAAPPGPAELRTLVYAALAEQSDPLLREIGQQLRDGLMVPAELDRAPEYRDVLRRGVTAIYAFDVERLPLPVTGRRRPPEPAPQ